jgi:hypothetical protein
MTTMLEAPVEMTARELAHQKYLLMKRRAVSEPTKFGPTEIPELPDGGERLFLSRGELLDFIRFGDYEQRLAGHSIVTRLDRDSGKYAVDITPLTRQDVVTDVVGACDDERN